MRCQNTKLVKFYLFTFSFSLAFLNNLLSPAYALPGQNRKTVIQWSQNHSKIPLLTSVNKLEEGYPDYSSRTSFSFKKYSVHMSVWVNSQDVVTEETIDARNDQNNRVNLEFTKNNNDGLQLINIIYGQTIVNDYQNAKYVDMVNMGGLIKFYKGNKYAYQVWRDGNSHQFTIIPLKDLVSRINNWKRQQ